MQDKVSVLKISKKNVINVNDWDDLVIKTYGKPYSFQQQDDCQPRGTVGITIPDEAYEEEDMNDSIPESVNGNEMGVKFEVWLERDPNKPLPESEEKWMIDLFWGRNFYPNLQTVANDLHKKGLIEAGEYLIDIDW